ncbi:MAG: hypothetical protein ABSH12_01455, partial [Endomicrobiales bacterium]
MQTINHTLTKVLAVTLLAVVVATGDDTSKDFTSYGPGVSAASYGDAATAYCPDISAYYYNPALLARDTQSTVSAARYMLFDDDNYNFIAIGGPLGLGYVCVAANQLASGDIELRNNIEDTPSIANTAQYTFTVTYAHPINILCCDAGISLKYLYQNLAVYSADAYGLDVGLSKSISISRFFTVPATALFGLTLRNLYEPTFMFIDEAETFPTTITLGTALRMNLHLRYSAQTQSFQYDSLTFMSDFAEDTDSHELNWRPGFEYGACNNYFFRAGYRDNVTLGIGYRNDSIKIDYAFDPKPYTQMHRISFAFSWGTPTADEQSDDLGKYRETRFEAQRYYDCQLKHAQELVESCNYDDAAADLRLTALIFPHNTKAQDLLKEIRQLKIASYLKIINAQIDANLSSKKYADAYRQTLDAIIFIPTDYDMQKKASLILNNAVLDTEGAASTLRQMRSDYLDKISMEIAHELSTGNFEGADASLETLQAIDPGSFAVHDKTKLIHQSRDSWVAAHIIALQEGMDKQSYLDAYLKAS